MTPIYLDNNATTALDPAVLAVMWPFLTEQYGNPSSPHRFGEPAQRALCEAREQVQALLGAALSREILFTSGGTESNVTAIASALAVQSPRRTVITTAVEHPAVLEACRYWAAQGYTVHILDVDGHGRLDLSAYQALLSEDVALVSVMWANNETGTIFPVVKMAEQAREVGALFHTDAVQAVGKVPIELRNTAIQMLSLSGHKLHGPKGIGVLYVQRDTPFQPLLRGGHQERGRRAGTENIPAIVGLGCAAELAIQRLAEDMQAMAILRDRLQNGLLAAIPDSYVIGDPEQRLANTLNVAFADVQADQLVLMLNKQGIAVSSGSACAAGSGTLSPVLQAMGLPARIAQGAIRLSLSRYTTDNEIDTVINVLPPIVDYLRQLNPLHHSIIVTAHPDPVN